LARSSPGMRSRSWTDKGEINKMGRIELIILLAIGLVYMTFPIITMVFVIQINKRLKQIEKEIELLRSHS
jgi:uncharacterized membrane protein (DUF485 family)